VLVTSALTASTAFAALGYASATRRLIDVDRRVGPRLMVRNGRPLRRVAETVSPVGKWYSQVGISLLLAGVIAMKGSRRPRADAAAIASAGLASAIAAHAFDRVLPQPPRPPGRRRERKPVYPSAHTMAPLAVALTGAYVAQREGMVDGRIAIPLALLVPAVTASEKLMARKHWMSDVIGGYAAGLAIACGVLGLYES
jgi:membrane-associated phospholipid phosphatase